MEDFVNQLVSKAGIDRSSAEKVVNYFRSHSDQIPQFLNSIGYNQQSGGRGGQSGSGGMFK